MSEPVEVIDTINSIQLVSEIAECFIRAGFTVFGEYVAYRLWCDKKQRDPTDIHTVMWYVHSGLAIPCGLYIDNTQSRSVKPVLEEISKKYTYHTINNDSYRLRVKQSIKYKICNKYPIYYDAELFIFNSLKMYKQHITFDIEALQYTSGEYSLCKQIKYPLDVVIRHALDRTAMYVCRMSGNRKKHHLRTNYVLTTENFVFQHWNVPEFEQHFPKDTSDQFCCIYCTDTDTSVHIIKIDNKNTRNSERVLCTGCLFDALHESSVASRYMSMIQAPLTKLILPI